MKFRHQRRPRCDEPRGGACIAQVARSAARVAVVHRGGLRATGLMLALGPQGARVSLGGSTFSVRGRLPPSGNQLAAARGRRSVHPPTGATSRTGSPTPLSPPRCREARRTFQGSCYLVALNAIDTDEPARRAIGVQVTMCDSPWCAVLLAALTLAILARRAAPGYVQAPIGWRRQHEQVIAFATMSLLSLFLAIKSAVRLISLARRSPRAPTAPSPTPVARHRRPLGNQLWGRRRPSCA